MDEEEEKLKFGATKGYEEVGFQMMQLSFLVGSEACNRLVSRGI